MLKRVQLINFQNHTDSVFEFVDGLNVLRGSSDSGKTAVVRAIRWVLFNRPLGDSLKKWGADFVKVVLEFDDCTITREKSKKFNGYYLFDISGGTMEKSFNIIKSDVPKEITGALDLLPENIQTQFDPYFLLQDSPGAVASKLNEAADMEIIGEITKEAASLKRDLDHSISSMEERLSEIESSLVIHKGAEKRIEVWNRFLSGKSDYDMHKDLHNSSNEIILSIVECEKRLSGLPPDLSDEDIIRFERKHLDYLKEKRLQDSSSEILSSIDVCSRVISSLPPDLSDDDINIFEKRYLEYQDESRSSSSKVDKTKNLSEEIRICAINISNTSMKIESIIDEAKPIFKGMKICVFCKSEIGGEDSEELFEKWVDE